MDDFITESIASLEQIMNNWSSQDITGGKMRSARGKDIETYVYDTINKIGKLTNNGIHASYGYTDKKILTVNDTCFKHHQVDIHIYKNDTFHSVIECKAYLDSCYYVRACDDFRLFDKFGYNLKYYIFALENSINDTTKLFTDIINDNICDEIFYCVDGKRKSAIPLYNNTHNTCNRDILKKFILTFWAEASTQNIVNTGDIQLYNGDCMHIMPEIPDGSIDMILCDLPYGVTKNKWDVVIPFDLLWNEYNRIIKDNGAIVLFGSQPFTTSLIASNYKYFRYSLVWEKNKFSDFLNAKRKPMKTNEDICIFYKKQPTYNPQYWYSTPYKRWNTQVAVNKQTNYNSHKENVSSSTDGKRLPTTVLKFNRIERPEHPTQKPVDLLEWLVKTYSNEHDMVLDNCMGVGSTAIACLNTQRKCIGIELNKEYYDIALKRINS